MHARTHARAHTHTHTHTTYTTYTPNTHTHAHTHTHTHTHHKQVRWDPRKYPYLNRGDQLAWQDCGEKCWNDLSSRYNVLGGPINIWVAGSFEGAFKCVRAEGPQEARSAASAARAHATLVPLPHAAGARLWRCCASWRPTG
jgi:hypothetical protein